MKNFCKTLILVMVAGAFNAPLASQAAADELSSLQADQELLQHRLAQLSQSTPFGGVEAPAGGPQVGMPMAGGSFPRSFLIPGTDTSLYIGGEIREVVAYFISGGSPNSSPQAATIGATGLAEGIPLNIHVPVPIGTATAVARARSDAIFLQTPGQSRLSVETRTPTGWGEARTLMQFDWSGSNNYLPSGSRGAQGTDDPLVPRLRFAYATLGGLLFGQANSNFTDFDASAFTIDFGGNFGEPGFNRIAQVRYTMPLTQWELPGALSASVETPETDAYITGLGIIGSDAGPSPDQTGGPANNPTKARAPDLTGAWYSPYSWGHLDFSTVVRPGLQLKDGLFIDRTYVGYGVHFSGDIKPGWFGWANDDITFQSVYGDGIGRYLSSSSTFALLSNYPATPPATAAAAANVIARTTTEWGGSFGYQHFWLDNLRSTISTGIEYHDLNLSAASGPLCTGATGIASARTTGTGGCSIDKELVSGHVNLVWSPVSFADFGVEYVYGHRIVLSNLKGDNHAILSRMRMQF